jgi:transposase-like protein
MTIECPVCGSANLEKKFSTEILKGDFGENTHYKKTYYKCFDCESESEGDFSEENTDAINSALDTLKKEYIKSALDYFVDNKISFSSVERILNLPQRTLTKWKNDVSQPSAAGIALLKFLRVFPWLLNVAEHSYDYDKSQKIFLQSAFNILLQKMSFVKNDTMEIRVFITNKSNLMYIYNEKNDETLVDNKKPVNTSCFHTEINQRILWRNTITPNNQRYDNEIKLFSYL